MVGTGEAINIEEFVIQGSDPKRVIVRGMVRRSLRSALLIH